MRLTTTPGHEQSHFLRLLGHIAQVLFRTPKPYPVKTCHINELRNLSIKIGDALRWKEPLAKHRLTYEPLFFIVVEIIHQLPLHKTLYHLGVISERAIRKAQKVRFASTETSKSEGDAGTAKRVLSTMRNAQLIRNRASLPRWYRNEGGAASASAPPGHPGADRVS